MPLEPAQQKYSVLLLEQGLHWLLEALYLDIRGYSSLSPIAPHKDRL